MALTPKTVYTYDLDGSNRDFPIPFDYLARKFITVTLIGADRKVLTLNTDYRFTQRTVITTTKPLGTGDGYSRIEIRRYTSATERLVDFSDGSILRAYDLNISSLQSLHIAEEARDVATDTIGADDNGQLDARGRRIVNLADAVDPRDAVSLGQVRGWDNSALNSATKSEASAQKSAASAVVSEEWAKAAQKSADEAQNLPRTVRVRPEDPILNPLPPREGRANKLLGFDNAGMPTVFLPTGGSAADVLLELQKANAATRIGYQNASYDTVAKALDGVLAGTATIPFKRPDVAGRVTSYKALADASVVSVWEYAYAITVKPDPNDPDTWDWTPAFELMSYLHRPVTNAAAPDKHDITFLIPAGRIYRIRSFTMHKHQHLFMAGGVIVPWDNRATEKYLIRFTGFNRVYGLNVDMKHAARYDTVILGRGRYMDFVNCSIWKARLAYTFGDPTWATDPSLGSMGDSECNIIGGEVNWGCQVVHIYGQNTIVTFSGGARGYGFRQALNESDPTNPNRDEWNRIPDHVAVNFGGMLYFTGCYIGNFGGGTAALLSEIGPVTGNASYFNRYGTFILNGTHIESAVLLETGTTGDWPAEDDFGILLQASGCHGYMAGSTRWWVSAGGKCRQKIVVSNCGFYGRAYTRLCYSLNAPVYLEPASFGNAPADFFTSMFVIRPMTYPNMLLGHFSHSNQSLTSIMSGVSFPVAQTADLVTGAAAEWYNVSNGRFTAKRTLRNVVVEVSLTFAQGALTDNVDIMCLVDDQQVDVSGGQGITVKATFTIRLLRQGQYISIRATNRSNRTLSGQSNTFIKVSANT